MGSVSVNEISELLQDVQNKGAGLTNNGENEAARQALLRSAQNLVNALQSPFEVVAKMNWLEPSRWTICRIGFDIHLFESMVADNGSPKSVDKLSQMTSCDPVLLARFLKHLYAADFVKETGKNEYAPNAITSILATRIASGMTKNCFDFMSDVHSALPEFLRNTNYKNPTNKDASPFKYGMKTDLHYFEWISQPGMESQRDDFKAHMEFKTLGKKWFQSVDVSQILNDPNTDEDAVLMIDIGGSFGHDVIDFQKVYPDLPGKLMLQELPAMVKELPADFPRDKIEPQPHDFFTPQPVHGAKAYYLHMILHDWPDESCRKILSNLKPALKKGYSKILLNEIVIPDQDANWFATSVDMIMLAAHAAQERTESNWKELAESVGLKVSKIWDCDGNPEKIIEVELA